MYKKIWGLKQLENLGFPCPPYQVIDVSGDKPVDLEDYILRKIRQVGIPHLKDDRVGVTIRVSLPSDLDKVARHGGLHVTEESQVLKRVLEKYRKYKQDGKIIVQHTVDARCSGTILKENYHITIEAISGDAPPLLEGRATDYETWVFPSERGKWKKERVKRHSNKEFSVLTQNDIQTLERYVRLSPNQLYMEWSLSKSGKLYFYEYLKLKGGIH